MSATAFGQAASPDVDQAGVDQAGGGGDAGDEGLVVVTARRVEEKLQDVPISITAVGGALLERTNSVTLDQIKQFAPSLQIFAVNPRNTNINIRNLGSNSSVSSDGLDPGVGVYVDEVYYVRPGQAVFDLIDIERVEILKGPQGTLFGRNTTAGAISITTKAPTFEPKGTAELSIGDYGYVQARAAASAPLIADTLAFRVSAATTTRDGFIRNVRTGYDLQNLNSQAIRGQLLFTPTDTLTLRLIGDHSIRKERCCISLVAGVVDTLPNGTPILQGVSQRFAALGYTPASLDPFDRVTDVDSPVEYTVKQGGVSAQGTWSGPGVAVTSVTALRTWNWAPENDFDSLGLSVLKRAGSVQRQKQFSQELRVASEGVRTIDYVAGLYYFYQTLPQAQVTEYGADAAPFLLPSTVPAIVGNAALNGFTTNGAATSKTWSYAGFGQANWHIDPRLTLTLGARYTHERKTGSYMLEQTGGIPLGTLPLPLAGAAQGIRDSVAPAGSVAAEVSRDSLSGLVTLAFKPVDAVLTYVTVSRGSKSGGFNIGSVLPPDVDPVIGPETVDHVEVGVKTSPLRGLTVNGALFRTDIDGFQANFAEQNPPRNYITNAAKVRSQGGELDIAYSPGKFANLFASATYADTTYRSYPAAPCPLGTIGNAGVCDLSGETLPNAPKWSLSGGGELSQPIGSALAYVGGDAPYRSSANSASNNSPFGTIAGYWLVNARAGVRALDGRLDLYVWARNLLDRDYFLNYLVAANGLITARVGDPRTVGVTARFRM